MVSKIFAAAMLAVASAQMSIVATVAATANLNTLLTTLNGPDYTDVKDRLDAATAEAPLTVFAPIDTANWDILSTVVANKQTLYYHVVSGNISSADLAAKQFVNTESKDGALLGGLGYALGVVKAGDEVTLSNGVATFTAKVVTPNVICTNGIVHLIDTVLQVPKIASATATLANLKELVKAVTTAMLGDIVDDTPKVTIFAPTDTAMLAAGWASLTVAQLQAVLGYHVIVGTVAYSTDVISGKYTGPVPTYQGQDVNVALVGGKVMINDAEVVTPDALIKNGVVHVINKVLSIPSNETVVTDAPTTASSATASSMVFACLFSVVAAVVLN